MKSWSGMLVCLRLVYRFDSDEEADTLREDAANLADGVLGDVDEVASALPATKLMEFRLDYMLESVPDDMLTEDDNQLAHAQANWRIDDDRWMMELEDKLSRQANRKWNEEFEKRTKFMQDVHDGKGGLEGDGRTGLENDDDGISDDGDADREYWRSHMRNVVLPQMMEVIAEKERQRREKEEEGKLTDQEKEWLRRKQEEMTHAVSLMRKKERERLQDVDGLTLEGAAM
mgnify:CR=1 FL=1